jgi:hypothetical protein
MVPKSGTHFNYWCKKYIHGQFEYEVQTFNRVSQVGWVPMLMCHEAQLWKAQEWLTRNVS